MPLSVFLWGTDLIDTKTHPEPWKTVDDLWLDARCYGQFGAIWERAEDNIALIMMRESAGKLPDDADVRNVVMLPSRSRTPKSWLTAVFPDPSFARDELGLGSRYNYWDTQRTLLDSNRKREAAYERMLDRLEAARVAALGPEYSPRRRAEPNPRQDDNRPRSWVPMNPNEHGRSALVTEEIKGADGKVREVTVDVRLREIVRRHRSRTVVQ